MWRNMVEDDKFKMILIENINEGTLKKLTDPDYYEQEGNKFDMKVYKK